MTSILSQTYFAPNELNINSIRMVSTTSSKFGIQYSIDFASPKRERNTEYEISNMRDRTYVRLRRVRIPHSGETLVLYQPYVRRDDSSKFQSFLL